MAMKKSHRLERARAEFRNKVQDSMKDVENLMAEVDRARAKRAEEAKIAEETMNRILNRLEIKPERTPSTFADYCRHVDKHLLVEVHAAHEMSVTSIGESPNSAAGKMYPRALRPWPDFAAAHAATFDTVSAGFGDKASFPSEFDLLANNMADMMSSRFPTADTVNRFLESQVEIVATKYVTDVATDANIDRVCFRDNKIFRMAADIIPAKWGCLYTARDSSKPHKDTYIFALSYMREDGLEEFPLRRVLGAHRGDDFFAMALPGVRDKHRRKLCYATFKYGLPHQYCRADAVNNALCATYHHMVSTGTMFGILASSEGLVFLRIDDEDPGILYYFLSLYPQSKTMRKVAGKRVDEAKDEAKTISKVAERAPVDTTLAQAISFCLWAAEKKRQPASWITHAKSQAKRWPEPYAELCKNNDEMGWPSDSWPDSGEHEDEDEGGGKKKDEKEDANNNIGNSSKEKRGADTLNDGDDEDDKPQAKRIHFTRSCNPLKGKKDCLS